jgi:predicted nucleic acid-binding protein
VTITHLLDTSVYSQPIKDFPLQTAMEKWSRIGDRRICTSSICLAEVLQGLELRDSDKYWHRYRSLLEHRYPVLPFDAPVAAVFAKMTSETRRLGAPRPALDMMIAATARCHGLTIATLNIRDFRGISGLAVEDWT